MRILVVEDDASFARGLVDLLMLQGHTVQVVGAADEALTVLDQEIFDVVVADYALGATTGADLARCLNDRAPAPFVVLMTGYATKPDDPAYLTPGVSAVLPKPFRSAELRVVLDRVSAAN